MTDYTYVPATGDILPYRETSARFAVNREPVGRVSPMIPDKAGNGIDASGALRLDGGSVIPVTDALGKHAEQQQIDAAAQSEIDRCQEIMLLPALLQHATYPSVHWAFSEVPLISTDSKYPLPDGCVQSEPPGPDGNYPRIEDDLYVTFDAKRHRTYIREAVSSLYCTTTRPDVAKLRSILGGREARHEQEAFDALRGIEDEVWLNGIDRQADDKTAAAMLRGIVHSTHAEYGSRITHMVMGARMYRRYLADSNICGPPVPGSSTGTPGMGPLPGLEYVTVIISPMPDTESKDVIYAVDRHSGALYGQGPISMDMNETAEGDTTGITEYYQYMITDNKVRHDYGDDVKRRTALRINVP